MKRLSIAFSPCPNDVFIFYAWIHGFVGRDLPIDPVMADVQTLNEWAMSGRYPVSKVSIGCLNTIADDYLLLDAGAAVGFGCGPKLIAREYFPVMELRDKILALPGEHTTAHQLFNILMPPPKTKVIYPYHLIVDRIVDGTVDCGVIIHETRFTYHESGLVEITDLGASWESQYALPIPLGGIVAAKNIDPQLRHKITLSIQQSVQYAWRHPQEAIAYATAYSQEKDPDVIKKHIDLYVNAETEQLSPAGKRSIERLCLEQSKISLSHLPHR